ncbi:MAG: winged helix-turn-helix domain-containing protein [Colwellia sp.]
MTQPYWINEYFVDPSRNHLCYKGEEIQIPKKELAVLTLLAENAGTVVSHDDLMEHIWGDTVVSPNTLQRYIAQLRKVFGDDSKKQAVIKTYPKVGYSLQATVKWQTQSVSTSLKSTKRNYSYLFFAVFLMLIIAAYIGLRDTDKPLIKLNSLTPITASDTDEVTPRYSPDGKYLVYRRYSKLHGIHLWAKNLSTNLEVQLTADSAKYGSYNWSDDANQLAFSVLSFEPGSKKPCWQIQTLDFTKAFKTPQKALKISPCEEYRMAVSRWITNDRIAVLVKQNGKNHTLQAYDIASKQLTEIYSPVNRDIYSYDFSFKSKTFAVVSRNNKNQHIIEEVNLNGKVLSTATISLSKDHSAHEYYNVYFEPNGEYLLTNTALGLFQLFFDGTMQKINTFGYRNLSEPNLHPQGNKLVAVQESNDQDIAIISLDSTEQLNDHLQPDTVSIARSNELDAAGMFQPNGELIAFASNRSGKKQIWLYDGNVAKQLTYFEKGIQTFDFVWSENGEQLAAVSNDTLMIISLDGKVQSLVSSLLVSKVMQWKSDNEITVIANKNNDNNAFLLSFNKQSLVVDKQKNLQVSKVDWLQFINKDTFVYVNSDRQTWIKNTNNDAPIQINLLEEKIGYKRLSTHDNTLYGINHKDQLWRYDFELKTLTTIEQLPNTALYISDFKAGKALITMSLRHNKEIVELELAQ